LGFPVSDACSWPAKLGKPPIKFTVVVRVSADARVLWIRIAPTAAPIRGPATALLRVHPGRSGAHVVVIHVNPEHQSAIQSRLETALQVYVDQGSHRTSRCGSSGKGWMSPVSLDEPSETRAQRGDPAGLGL